MIKGKLIFIGNWIVTFHFGFFIKSLIYLIVNLIIALVLSLVLNLYIMELRMEPNLAQVKRLAVINK